MEEECGWRGQQAHQPPTGIFLSPTLCWVSWDHMMGRMYQRLGGGAGCWEMVWGQRVAGQWSGPGFTSSVEGRSSKDELAEKQ